ncbi:MAG: family transcriptional regulator, cyclic receptor protein [Pseudonocardiales bacterium]|nr:family transcriptional regulator, cyclic receptor protein [Pseudonocardiales bacterium]
MAQSEEVLNALARSYLFEGLTVEQLRPLCVLATTRQLVRGEAVCRVGDRADEIYVVALGEVKDCVVDADGYEVVHSLHGPGMTFGEAGFFATDQQRILEVVATRPTLLIRVGRRALVPFLVQHPALKDRVIEKFASNQRWLTVMISSLASKPLTDRLVLRLLELADSSPERRQGLSVTPKITQTTLAAMIGVSREHVNRALAALTASGAVRQEGGRYVLVDEERLRREVTRGVGPMVHRRDRRITGEVGDAG